MKSLAQIMAEDKKLMAHIFRSYKIIPEHVKNKRKQERIGDVFRFEGMYENMAKNTGTCREYVSKRGL